MKLPELVGRVLGSLPEASRGGAPRSGPGEAAGNPARAPTGRSRAACAHWIWVYWHFNLGTSTRVSIGFLLGVLALAAATLRWYHGGGKAWGGGTAFWGSCCPPRHGKRAP